MLCVQHRRGCYCAKSDIDSALRLVPMSFQSLKCLGFTIDGLYFINICLPFGASSSCYIFKSFSSFLDWYICNQILSTLKTERALLGVPVSHEKTTIPATKITFLGLDIDTILMLIIVPQDKIDKTLNLIRQVLSQKKMMVAVMQSLCGTEVHWYTDSTAKVGLGFGCFFQGKWTNGCWPLDFILHYPPPSIAVLELFPIAISIYLWADQLAGQEIIHHTDNQSAHSMVNNQTASCPYCMVLIRLIVLQCLRYNILLTCE